MAEQLTLPAARAALLEPYLPPAPPEPHLPPAPAPAPAPPAAAGRPFVTLTFATSLDSALALAPGARTRLSGPESQAMTHFLRSRHAAVLIGVSTLLADDPALSCRAAGAAHQPRPVVVDPRLRWAPRPADCVLAAARAGAARGPLVLTAVADAAARLPRESVAALRDAGGRHVYVAPAEADGPRVRFDWRDVLAALRAEGLASVMVEGGACVINSLLSPPCHGLVDSVVVTIAPTWLGRGGVVVSPERAGDDQGCALPAARLSHVSWHPFGEDVVLCGKLRA